LSRSNSIGLFAAPKSCPHPRVGSLRKKPAMPRRLWSRSSGYVFTFTDRPFRSGSEITGSMASYSLTGVSRSPPLHRAIGAGGAYNCSDRAESPGRLGETASVHCGAQVGDHSAATSERWRSFESCVIEQKQTAVTRLCAGRDVRRRDGALQVAGKLPFGRRRGVLRGGIEE
jgi:hypothetical protein